MCPKHKNTSKLYVDFVTASAVAQHNVGYQQSNLCEMFGFPTGSGMIKYLQNKDRKINTPYKRKARNKRMRKDLQSYIYPSGDF